MHCPSCGLESSLDQKFCRKCGFNLEPVSKLVTGAGATEQIEPDKREAENLIVRRMFRWLSWGCIVLLIGVVLAVVNKEIPPAPILKFLASFLLLSGVSIVTYGVLSSVIQGTYVSRKASKDQAQIDQNRATKELPEERTPIPVPSVTERTTQLIGEDKHNGTHASGALE